MALLDPILNIILLQHPMHIHKYIYPVLKILRYTNTVLLLQTENSTPFPRVAKQFLR